MHGLRRRIQGVCQGGLIACGFVVAHQAAVPVMNRCGGFLLVVKDGMGNCKAPSKALSTAGALCYDAFQLLSIKENLRAEAKE